PHAKAAFAQPAGPGRPHHQGRSRRGEADPARALSCGRSGVRPLLASTKMAVCYRHPSVETGVSCSSFGRPICTDCMTPHSVGMPLEPAIGRLNFFAIYMASLFAGSFGALLFQPNVVTVGASGAIFGIFGALIVVAHNRGIPIWQSGLGIVLVFNLVLTFG